MPHITFVHGICNKPPKDRLLQFWHESLARDGGIDLGANGVTSSMVYWADLLYPEPDPNEPTFESAELAESPDLAIKSTDPKLGDAWKAQMPADEQLWLARLSAKMKVGEMLDELAPPTGDPTGPEFERIPLPGFLKKEIMQRFLRDVHHYLFNVQFSVRPGDPGCKIQDEIRSRFVAAIQEGATKEGPHVVVSHSMGTVIAYDNLMRVADCPRVDHLVTIGSPLGVDEVQDGLKPEYNSDSGFPAAKVSGRWVNVYDHFDPVAGVDPHFANDYKKGGEKVVEDINEQNWGKWRHDISKYMKGAQLRQKLSELLDL
ncbi:MAG: hypothetical protein ACKV2V_17375 [Blastocatellia bacterium]